MFFFLSAVSALAPCSRLLLAYGFLLSKENQEITSGSYLTGLPMMKNHLKAASIVLLRLSEVNSQPASRAILRIADLRSLLNMTSYLSKITKYPKVMLSVMLSVRFSLIDDNFNGGEQGLFCAA